MERAYVESSTIRSVLYEEDDATLEIEFHGGAVYRYFDVPQHEYDGLLAADSKGKYAHENIFKRYRYQRVA